MTDVYQRLHDDVVSGVLDPGEPLVEATLAHRYGVSRTPVREALNRLEHDGLVERRHRSLRVRERTPAEILEIYEVRITLEGLAAREAARHRTEWDLRRLAATHKTMVELPTDAPPADRATTNRAYHEALWAAAHSATLVDLLHRLHDHLRRYPETTLAASGRWAEAIEDHRALNELIAARDDEGARELAQQHMQAARDIRLSMFDDDA
jgi:DNA-binding GntR family transcriptional regulator